MQLVSTRSEVCRSAIVCFQVCFLRILPICTSVWLQGTHWGFFGCDSIVLSKLLAPDHCQGTHWGFLATFLSSWHSSMISVQHRYWSCVVTKVASVRKLHSLTLSPVYIRLHRGNTFAFSLDRRLLQQGEGQIGRTMPPQPEWTAQPSSAPSGSSRPQVFRNDHRNDTTSVQVQLRQLRLISSTCRNLETLSERFAVHINWSKRYTHLRGMVDSVILAHQVRVLVSPVGEDLGRLS